MYTTENLYAVVINTLSLVNALAHIFCERVAKFNLDRHRWLILFIAQILSQECHK